MCDINMLIICEVFKLISWNGDCEIIKLGNCVNDYISKLNKLIKSSENPIIVTYILLQIYCLEGVCI